MSHPHASDADAPRPRSRRQVTTPTRRAFVLAPPSAPPLAPAPIEDPKRDSDGALVPVVLVLTTLGAFVLGVASHKLYRDGTLFGAAQLSQAEQIKLTATGISAI